MTKEGEGLIDMGCPRHGEKYLSVYFDDLRDMLKEHCTVRGCNFEREHVERRKKNLPVDSDRRKK